MDRGAIFIVEGDRMKIAAQLGHSEKFVDTHRNMKVGDCLCGLAAQKGEVIISANSSKDSRHTMSDPYSTPHGHLVVPLKTKERVEGVLDLYVPADIVIDEDRVKVLHAIGNQLGIAVENARLYEETKALSLRDSLTGLWNHGEILRILGQELSRAGREGGCVTVMMVDLDHFKKVNDTFGHMAGDAVLRLTAERMLSIVRPYDAVGRYGGEEFLVVLTDCDRRFVSAISERFRACIGDEDMDTPGGPVKMTMSLGVAMSGRSKTCTVDSIVQAADSALYRAKEKGRNRVEIDLGEG
jgi:diguanylate cyclase (GGDEF)-like protein